MPSEAKLTDRETRVDLLKIRDLDLAERERYLGQWQALQSRFVDYPKGTVTEADELVTSANMLALLDQLRAATPVPGAEAVAAR